MPQKGKRKNKIVGVIFGLMLVLLVSAYVFLTKNNGLAVDDTKVEFEHPQIPKVDGENKLRLLASSYIVIDVDTNIILAKKDINKRMYPASITKLVTAMTALNIFPLDETITVTEYLEGKNMKLINDDKLTARGLVEAILIHSANDAAYNLAKHHWGGISGFVDEMNSLVTKYGLKNTHFVNFDGIHSEKHYSSAYDLSQIARMALKNEVITSSVKVKSKEITSLLGNRYFLETTNELLGIVPEIQGMKTGWTLEAGGCFIGLIKIGNKQVLSVVLNSPDRFSESRQIVDWLKESVSWQNYSATEI